ncbi:MAG: hypothetical protein WCW56_03690 [Candidatus Paceibacterota bacterium]
MSTLNEAMEQSSYDGNPVVDFGIASFEAGTLRAMPKFTTGSIPAQRFGPVF